MTGAIDHIRKLMNTAVYIYAFNQLPIIDWATSPLSFRLVNFATQQVHVTEQVVIEKRNYGNEIDQSLDCLMLEPQGIEGIIMTLLSAKYQI